MTFTPNSSAAGSTNAPGHGSSGFKITIAQSIVSANFSIHKSISSVNPFAGPGAMPSCSVSPASFNAAMPSQTASLV